MIKSEPLLSICIPAYNREKYLKRLIESIVSQEEFIETDEVEIIVDDGPSSDNTESMVKEYIKKY
jgi:abequosyltransferase